MPRKAVVFDVPEGEKEDAKAEKLARSPLFAGGDGDQDAIEAITIERLAPVREGTLPGKLEPEATEDEIAARWGGGKFRLWARSSGGRLVTNRVIEIGGEPVFASEHSRQQYRRMMGAAAPPEAPALAGPAGPAAPSWQEMLAMQAQADERRREDYQRRAEEQEKAHAREMERIRLDGEMRERERQAEDERRRKESEEREERRRKDAEEARQRDREFHATMIQVAQASGQGKSDPIETLMRGFQLGQSMAGGDPPDPVTALASNLPAILDRAGSLIPSKTAEQVPPTQGPARGDQIMFGGKVGVKARRAVEHLRAQGVDPEAMLEHAFDMLLATRRQTAPPEPPATASPAVPVVTPPPPSSSKRFPPRPAPNGPTGG